MARPSTYNAKVAAEILTLLAEGKSLRAICAADDMPAQSTVFLWLASHIEFSEQYSRAREAQADFLADEILEIADTPQEGVRTEETDEGTKIVREDMLGHRRLQVDARKWFASKVAPKKYGDRLTHGGDPDAPMSFTVKWAGE